MRIIASLLPIVSVHGEGPYPKRGDPVMQNIVELKK
jgi:hypothetical protein